jgi:hypothetical protein
VLIWKCVQLNQNNDFGNQIFCTTVTKFLIGNEENVKNTHLKYVKTLVFFSFSCSSLCLFALFYWCWTTPDCRSLPHLVSKSQVSISPYFSSMTFFFSNGWYYFSLYIINVILTVYIINVILFKILNWHNNTSYDIMYSCILLNL